MLAQIVADMTLPDDVMLRPEVLRPVADRNTVLQCVAVSGYLKPADPEVRPWSF